MSPQAHASEAPRELSLAASTSSSMSLALLIAAVGRAGGKPQVLLRRIGLTADAVRQPDGRIPFEALMRAWEIAPELVADDAFGLHVGAALPRGALGLIEYCARASATLHEAADRLLRYQRLLHDRARFALSLSETRATLSAWIAGASAPPPRHFQESMVAALLTFARDVTGDDVTPLEVAFQHAAPRATAEHGRVLRGPIRFSAPQCHIVLPRAVLELPLRDADPALARVLDDCAARALARLPPIADGVRLCRELIARQIAAGVPPRVGYIARELALSPRSLQRALGASGWSFRSLVDDVRREVALAMVINGAEQASQIAYRLGYGDASAFHNAFRRWTGHTVAQVRQRGLLQRRE
jgi:AraC-like DNA-binding protein